jgi:hypothetical protein
VLDEFSGLPEVSLDILVTALRISARARRGR